MSEWILKEGFLISDRGEGEWPGDADFTAYNNAVVYQDGQIVAAFKRGSEDEILNWARMLVEHLESGKKESP